MDCLKCLLHLFVPTSEKRTLRKGDGVEKTRTVMEFKCKKEAISEDGSKIMEFTKGKEYTGVSDGEGGWYIEDDNGRFQYFFNTNIMFKATTI